MAVTIQQIKSLQERTGAGIMDCKKALVEADGNEEKAIDILREKGIAKAAAKAARVAAEGLAVVKICSKCGKAAIVEVNCETDFVSGSPKFHEFVDGVLESVFTNEPKTIEEAKELTQGLFTDATVAMRENFVFRRFEILHAEGDQSFGTYSHGNGRSTSLVVLSKEADANLAKGLAMTIVSASPRYLNIDDVPAEDRERELAIARTEVANDPKLTSKPDAIKENIVVRKVDSRLGELCLDHAIYALDPDGSKTVAQVEKETGVNVLKFVRYTVGEASTEKGEEE